MRRVARTLVLLLAMTVGAPVARAAQITTGTVAGVMTDGEGRGVADATVVLLSESRRTTLLPVTSTKTGSWVVVNVPADTYTAEITSPGFKAIKRGGIVVTGGDRVSLGVLAFQIGRLDEVVEVNADVPLLQARSGERSFAVSTIAVENLPVIHGNFVSLAAFAPGVFNNATRLGGGGENNVMLDGTSLLDTGTNTQMMAVNIESVAAIQVLVQGYAAEYGRSSGLQISSVAKWGTDRFHGSVYELRADSRWNTINWAAGRNGDPKASSRSDTFGYSIGGPAGRPGSQHRLFFFYAHEFRPSTSPTNGGSPIRIRVPTAAERSGDFSQTLDQSGALLNLIKDPSSPLPCTPVVTSGCFQVGGVFGRIPASSLYTPGLALLNRYPLPNLTQAPGTNYNYEVPSTSLSSTTTQPVVRVDYQATPALRIAAKYAGQRSSPQVTPGSLPGFNDVLTPYPFIANYGVTADYAVGPTMFLEATYGLMRNQPTNGGIVVNPSANSADPANGLSTLPLIYPGAGAVDASTYAYRALQDLQPPWWNGTSVNLPPTFAWGPRIGAPPPNQSFPVTLGTNRTQDVAVSLTTLRGSHTFKVGFYNNHSYKAQNAFSSVPGLSPQGLINFGSDANGLDTGFGFANAAVGFFAQDLQQSAYVEADMVYNNTEFYAEDNWKMSPRLTLDYGLRFTHESPQYDTRQQMSTFLPDRWDPSAAQVLYTSVCAVASPCAPGAPHFTKNPVTGALVTTPGAGALVGTPVPGYGNPLNGIVRAGDGIADTGYTWPALVVGPRVGGAYDVTGTQRMVVRGSIGVFYDRPDGNTVLAIPGNPPMAQSTDLRDGVLSSLGVGITPQPLPSLSTFQYDAKIPTSTQWNIGAQFALPWASALDVSYVGQHGWNELGGQLGAGSVNLNGIDFGTAYLPAFQNPTLPPNTVPGANALSADYLRPYQGLGVIAQQTTRYHETYQSIQSSVIRRFRNGLEFGLNYTLGLSYTGNIGLQLRLQHNADGSISVRDDQAAYEALNNNLDNKRHTIKGSAVWNVPQISASGAATRALAAVVNNWHLAGVLTTGSGAAYDLNYQYTTAGTQTNLTGSPDYAAKIVYTGDPGSGCSSNLFAQFNAAAVTGPAYHSTGLESGRNVMRGCPDKAVDLAIVRAFPVGGGRRVDIRLDAFNAFNAVVITNRNTVLVLTSPTDPTVRNAEFLPNGSVDPTHTTPRSAGFGAATAAAPMRSIQLTARFSF